jgi:hypothetical protein
MQEVIRAKPIYSEKTAQIQDKKLERFDRGCSFEVFCYIL